MQKTEYRQLHGVIAALLKQADAANEPGKREYRDDAHAKHELQGLPFHIGDGTTADWTFPV